MRLTYGLCDESYKLTAGSYFVFRPESVADMPKSLELVSGRRDSAAFQLILTADADFTLSTAVHYTLSQDWTLPVVRIAADPGLRVFIEDMHEDDDRRLRADALLPSTQLTVRAGETRALWIEKEIPADFEPGAYTLTARLLLSDRDSDETLIGTVSAALQVYPFVLPDTREQRFHLDLWQHSSNLARKHEVPLWSDAHFEVLERYVRSLGELGQKAVTLVVSEIPWRGQSCFNAYREAANLFEYSIIPVTRRADGRFFYDYSVMQRYIDLCAKYGIDRELSLYGLSGVWTEKGEPQLVPGYPDNIRIRYLDEADGCMKFIRESAQADDYIASLEQYFIRTGQIDRVRLAADEPGDTARYRRALAHLAEIAPAFRFKAAINHAEFIPEFGREVWDFAPFIHCLCREYDKIREYKATMPGKRFLWYVCCGPDFPNTFLRSKLTESWLIGVLTAYAGLDGFLRWNYTVLNDDPRADIRYSCFPAGDINFVYPARSGGPLLTLRWKALQRGIRFYELLVRLRERDAAAFREACGMVIFGDLKDFLDPPKDTAALCSTDSADYRRLMRFLLEKLS